MTAEGAFTYQRQPGRSNASVYTAEFKAEAVRLALEHGYTYGDAGKKLGVPPKSVANWARPLRKGKRLTRMTVGIENNDPAALRAQISELQKQLRRAEMERDILKKFSQYAATQMP